MKENKPLLVVISVFLLVSVGLLSAAVYLYIKKPNDAAVAKKRVLPVVAVLKSHTRDSLQKEYAAAMEDLTVALPSKVIGNADREYANEDTLTNQTATTNSAVEKLRNEINTILQDKSSTADLEMARMKIGELQTLVNILKNKNTDITKENERLYALLRQLAIDGKTTEPITAKMPASELTTSSKTSGGGNLKVDNIQLSAIATTDFMEKETSNAGETDKLIGSFNVKNGGSNSVSEVMVVVVQPNGKVLQNSNWETGIFYTKAGKQIYSNKLRFDNNGETKKLNFSLQADRYLPGKYTVEVYYNGMMIGRTTKTLS